MRKCCGESIEWSTRKRKNAKEQETLELDGVRGQICLEDFLLALRVLARAEKEQKESPRRSSRELFSTLMSVKGKGNEARRFVFGALRTSFRRKNVEHRHLEPRRATRNF